MSELHKRTRDEDEVHADEVHAGKKFRSCDYCENMFVVFTGMLTLEICTRMMNKLLKLFVDFEDDDPILSASSLQCPNCSAPIKMGDGAGARSGITITLEFTDAGTIRSIIFSGEILSPDDTAPLNFDDIDQIIINTRKVDLNTFDCDSIIHEEGITVIFTSMVEDIDGFSGADSIVLVDFTRAFNLRKIQDECFIACISLEGSEVNLTNCTMLEYIGENAFYRTGLRPCDFSLPAHQLTIGFNALNGANDELANSFQGVSIEALTPAPTRENSTDADGKEFHRE